MLSAQIAWRFSLGKRKNRFISFISASSVLGIGLGTMVLIVLLSVMNGFERELKDRLLTLIPHGELIAVPAAGMQDWRSIATELQQDSRIRWQQPFVKATGMLQKQGQMKALEITGIDPSQALPEVYQDFVSEEAWQRFQQQDKGVLLGSGVLQILNLQVGDKVQLLLPQLDDGPRLKPPKSVWLTVAGAVNFGGEVDSLLGLMPLPSAAEALGVSEGAQGIQLYYQDPFAASAITRELGYQQNQPLYISDWTRTQGHLYNDIRLVRVVVYLALVLLIAVACFNIISTLVMAVNEKSSEIAMLKSMGAENRLIVRIFVWQGAIYGLLGTLGGVSLGALLASNLQGLVRQLENLLGLSLLSGDIYFIDFLPSELQWSQVLMTAAIALSLSLAATWYPARTAARIQPAIALNR